MKKTAKTLIASGLAILLCLSMLAGSTFAWFTDEVKSGNNVIMAGNLDIEMHWTKDLTSGTWINAEDQNAEPVFNYDKWEPGYTEVRYVKIVNAGSLAFKYALSIIPDGEVSELADVIDVYFVENPSENISGRAYLASLTAKGTLRDAIKGTIPANGVLLADGQSKTGFYSGEVVVAIALKMREEAGNEYMGKSIGDSFSLKLVATQYDFESDSFGTDYDSNVELPGPIVDSQGTVTVTPDANGKVPAGGAAIDAGNGISALVPEGVQMSNGANKLTLSVTNLDDNSVNLIADYGQIQRSLDVHVAGVSNSNTVPLEITIEGAAAKGLNSGSLKLYHVEDGNNNEMTEVGLNEAFTAHNQFKYDPLTGDLTLNMATFSPIYTLTEVENAWEGKIGTGFAGGDGGADDPYLIANADQLAYFGAAVGGMLDNAIEPDSFEGKYVKLVADINLGDKNDANTGLIFHPIGYYYTDDKNGDGVTGDYYSTVSSFEGTFDGDGHTIKNFYQNTWDIKGDYEGNYYSDAMGLFGYVVNGTVKNLTVDNFSSDGEFTPTGVIAAYSTNSTFENIAITNCNPRVYNTGNGGIVGIGGESADTEDSKLVFNNITIDNTNKITALWGSWDVACGGLIGMFRGAGQVEMINCHVGAQIDVFNDVCGNYQYYWYRYAGMMIGTNKNMITDKETGRVYPETSKFKAEGCTVHFGDWNNYYYCELVANSLASYTHDHQFSRLVQVESVDVNKMKYTPIDGTEQDIPTSGRVNYVVVNGAHSTENATCYHFVDGVQHHHADEGTETVDVNGDGVKETVLKEDRQHYYLPFNQLLTGYGWGVNYIPVYDEKNPTSHDLPGVTILDNTPQSEEKFQKNTTKNVETVTTGFEIKLGELFSAIADPKYDINSPSVHVSITNLSENGKITARYTPNTADWTQGTIRLFNDGENDSNTIRITIQDYYYCQPCSIEVTVVKAKMNYILKGEDLLHQITGKVEGMDPNLTSRDKIKSTDTVDTVKENGYVKIVADRTPDSIRIDEGLFYAFKNDPRAGEFLNNETQETGQYVVIKYRIPEIYNTETSNISGITSFEIWSATGDGGTTAGKFNDCYNNYKSTAELMTDNQWHIFVLDLTKYSNAATHFTSDEYGRYYANFLRIDILPEVNIGQEIDVEFVGMSNSIEGIINTVNEMQNAEDYNTANKVEQIKLIAQDISIPLNFDIEEVAGEYIDPDSGYTASNFDYHACIDFINTDGSKTAKFNGGHTDSTLRFRTIDYKYETTKKIYFNGWMAVKGGINKYVWSADGGKTWNDIVVPITASGHGDATLIYANYDHFSLYDNYEFVASDFDNGGFQSIKIQLDLSEYLGQTVDIVLAAVPRLNKDELCVMTVVENVVVLPEDWGGKLSKTDFFSLADYAGNSEQYSLKQNYNGSITTVCDMNSEEYSNIKVQGWATVRSGVSKLVWSVDGKKWFEIDDLNYIQNITSVEEILILANNSSPADWEDFTEDDVIKFQRGDKNVGYINVDLTKLDPSYNGKTENVIIAAVPKTQADVDTGAICILFVLKDVKITGAASAK